LAKWDPGQAVWDLTVRREEGARRLPAETRALIARRAAAGPRNVRFALDTRQTADIGHVAVARRAKTAMGRPLSPCVRARRGRHRRDRARAPIGSR